MLKINTEDKYMFLHSEDIKMGEYLLGIDIGTSACKVAVFDRLGNVLSSATADYPVYYPQAGWAEQYAQDWYTGVCKAIGKIWEADRVKPQEIAGIGIDGQGWSAIAIDKNGECLTATPIWMDTRAQKECDFLNKAIGEERIFDIAGNGLNPSYTTPKIIWYRDNLPEVFEKTDKILHANGYIGYRLTGAVTEDICDAYGWHCFNMHTGKWDPDMAKELGIPKDFLPEIVNCDQIIGTITHKAAVETGLAEGTPVVAGGLDAACGTLGAGVIHNGETQEQGGQAGGMSICLDSYKADKRLILSYHVIPGKWLLQGGTTGGGGVMRWFEKEFAGEERLKKDEIGKSSLEQLNDIAGKINPGCDGLVFLPYMNGERSPIWNPKAKGVFYGLDFAKTKGHMVRACMEGVAFSLKHNLEIAREAGASVQVLRSMGGSANSLLWTQIKSDITGKPIVVPSSDTATTLGAVMLAGVATGVYKDYEEAVKLTVHDTRSHEPNGENTAVYDEVYDKYIKIYESLENLMK